MLDNLKAAVRRSRWATLVQDLRAEPDEVALGDFLDRHDHRLEDVYRRGSWTRLRREAGRASAPRRFDTRGTRSKALGRLTHLDDPERVCVLPQRCSRPTAAAAGGSRRTSSAPGDDARVGFGSGAAAHDDSRRGSSRRCGVRRQSELELVELLDVVDQRSRTPSSPSLLPGVPLTLHARYSRQEVVAALGFGRRRSKPKVTQGGILWVPQAKSDVFFVDLHKAERDYSPTTMYRDYAINRELFHWESQSRQTPQQPTVQRYIITIARGHVRPPLCSGAQDVRARNPTVHVPRASRLRRSPRGATRRVHVATHGPDARGAVRGGAQRRGGLTSHRSPGFALSGLPDRLCRDRLRLSSRLGR